MKTKIISHKAPRLLVHPKKPNILKVVVLAVALTGLLKPIQAQDTIYTKPLLWFGLTAGANVNFYQGSTQKLNDALTVPTAFHEGIGLGLFAGPEIDIFRPGTHFGVMVAGAYDSRKGTFNEVSTPCNCPADLNTKITYISVEPSLKYAPFKSSFYLFGGPRFAFNMSKSFTYSLGINPAYPDQAATNDVSGDFSNINTSLISMQVGAGFDIPLTNYFSRTQLVFSPFVSFHPYFGQDPRSIETWNVTTIRAGAAIKIGSGRLIKEKAIVEEVVIVTPINTEVIDTHVDFSVYSPENIPLKRKISEIFPIRNYIFFDIGSTEIPKRYVQLNKEQVLDFNEKNVVMYTSDINSGRSQRQMTVYYNILNILGSRMNENPSTTITLLGASEKGSYDGLLMAESVKKYLVDVFAIEPERIKTVGQDKPKLPSEQNGITTEVALHLEGDRRVSIESSSPVLLMEFQSGPEAPLKPVVVEVEEEAPVESYVSFFADGSNESFESWSLEITDEDGVVQNFGPFTEEYVAIPGKTILGTRSKGDFKVNMVGKTENGYIIQQDTTVHLVLWTQPVDEELMRFSVLYGFNESNISPMYKKYLTDVVVPKIPAGGKIIIHGHTDMIGDAAYNQKLSLDRANNVKQIIENELIRIDRSNVKFDVVGLGEDVTTSPFDNKYPEERFYNRTVIIEIIPFNAFAVE
ncbi:MAG: flagellar motor protein MotB [Bacteroidetes bacterium HGW-Bacteroidetes-6]|jgi:outer membrane protein OmpA-like peptidoglycan-associated protein|nr:MAG: flagellar motor protein MotB [Bacteroidetes bacterium HGW-Bacteroidetes-6]